MPCICWKAPPPPDSVSDLESFQTWYESLNKPDAQAFVNVPITDLRVNTLWCVRGLCLLCMSNPSSRS